MSEPPLLKSHHRFDASRGVAPKGADACLGGFELYVFARGPQGWPVMIPRRPEVSVQVPFGTDSFASNPDPRCPCVLVLDVSGSMTGEPIRHLNDGLQQFRDELLSDPLAARRAEIATVTFGPVSVVHDFIVAESYQPPVLAPQGDTPMGAAILQAIQLVQQRKQVYQQNGIMYFRPWIFLITDGAPTDSWKPAAMAVREGEAANKFAFFAVGVENANMDVLRQISSRSEPLKLQGLHFREMFAWLSASMKRVSASSPGEQVALPDPTGPKGWATV
jgi:uncharacterized protein YegL